MSREEKEVIARRRKKQAEDKRYQEFKNDMRLLLIGIEAARPRTIEQQKAEMWMGMDSDYEYLRRILDRIIREEIKNMASVTR